MHKAMSCTLALFVSYQEGTVLTCSLAVVVDRIFQGGGGGGGDIKFPSQVMLCPCEIRRLQEQVNALKL